MKLGYLVIGVALLGLIALIGFSVTGNVTGAPAEPGEDPELVALRDSLSACEAEKTSLSSDLTIAGAEASGARRASDECAQRLQGIKDAVNDANDRAVEAEGKLDGLEEQLEELQEDYDSVTLSSATSTCCKARVDNPNISYWDVQDGKIICSEVNGTDLNCP